MMLYTEENQFLDALKHVLVYWWSRNWVSVSIGFLSLLYMKFIFRLMVSPRLCTHNSLLCAALIQQMD